MRIIAFLFALLVLPSLVAASTFQSYSLTAEMGEDTVAFYAEITGSFANEVLTLQLLPGVEHLQIVVDDLEVACTQKEEEGYTSVICGVLDGPHTIDVQYESAYPLIPLAESVLFQMQDSAVADTFRFTLKLPVGSIVEEERLVTPEPESMYSDGKRIILVWEEAPSTGDFAVSVVSKSIVAATTGLYVLIAVLVTLLIGSGYWYYTRSRRISEAVKEPENVSLAPHDVKKEEALTLPDMLLENEKKVIAVLQEHGGKVWQKQLEIATGIPKVKLSRLLKSLEKRNILRKEPYGASNMILLLEKKEP